jgi:hypothetical protein
MYHSHGDVPANCADRPNLAKAPAVGGGIYYGSRSDGSLQRIDDSMRRMDARWGWLDRIF